MKTTKKVSKATKDNTKNTTTTLPKATKIVSQKEESGIKKSQIKPFTRIESVIFVLNSYNKSEPMDFKELVTKADKLYSQKTKKPLNAKESRYNVTKVYQVLQAMLHEGMIDNKFKSIKQ